MARLLSFLLPSKILGDAIRGAVGGGGPGAGVDDILMETGDHLLLETGDATLLDP